MKKTSLVLTILLCLVINGKSQTDPKREQIKYLFSLMHQDSLINKTFATISSSIATQVANAFKDTMFTNTGINYSEEYSRIMQKSMEVAKENAKRLMNEDMVDIYDKYFTLDDIEGFIKFYKSPSGQKLIDKLPDISKDIMTVMSVKYQPALQQSIMKEIDEMTKGTSQQ